MFAFVLYFALCLGLLSVLYLFVTEFVTLFFADFCNFNWI